MHFYQISEFKNKSYLSSMIFIKLFSVYACKLFMHHKVIIELVIIELVTDHSATYHLRIIYLK